MKLAVIMSVYNGGDLLKKSIESLFIQKADKIEFLIIDDCSSDNSRLYLDSIRDFRFKIFYNDSNKGLFPNLNYLITKTDADLVTLWSQDDIMYGDALNENILIHEKYPEIGFSYASRDIIDQNGGFIDKYNGADSTPEFIDFNLYFKICAFTGSISGNIANVTFKRKYLIEMGCFNTSMFYSSDFDMQVKVGLKYPVGRISKPTYALRNHSEQLSKKTGYEIYQLKDDLKVFLYLSEQTKNKDLKIYLKSCLNWKRSIYYLAVWKKIIKRGNLYEIMEYAIYMSKIEFLLFTFIRAFLIKFNFYKGPKL